MEWKQWPTQDSEEAIRAGISFDRTPAGPISAPTGWIRVCAYHIDFDGRPTCFVDVATAVEARAICADLRASCSWNVDYAMAWDDRGAIVESGRPY